MDQPAQQDPEERPYSDLPERRLTADQLVAYNLAVYRKAAGLSQEDLAEILTAITGRTWSKASVSAAERSFDGDRTKLFPAEQLLSLAEAFELPINAFLLPPMDDGASVRYVIQHNPQTAASTSMGAVLDRLFPPSDSEGKAIDLYWARVHEAFEYHVGTTAYSDIEDPRMVPNFRTALNRLEGQRAALLSIARDMDHQIEQVRTWVERSDEEGDGES